MIEKILNKTYRQEELVLDICKNKACCRYVERYNKNGVLFDKISVKHHYEPSWEDMYKYLCENNDLEEAMELSKDVNDYENIYVCENDSFVLFYEILA